MTNCMECLLRNRTRIRRPAGACRADSCAFEATGENEGLPTVGNPLLDPCLRSCLRLPRKAIDKSASCPRFLWLRLRKICSLQVLPPQGLRLPQSSNACPK